MEQKDAPSDNDNNHRIIKLDQFDLFASLNGAYIHACICLDTQSVKQVVN